MRHLLQAGFPGPVLAVLLAGSHALAQSPERWPSRPSGEAPSADRDGASDRLELLAQSRTHLQLFRRALLPGPGGAIVTSHTAAPLTEYLSVSARDVDSRWHRDALDVEFAAWGRLWPTPSDHEPPFDGDIQTANVGYRLGSLRVRLGRQLSAGGAARFSRFDGVTIGFEAADGVRAAAYAGFAVLPRWDSLPGYHQLGRAERELLRDAPLEAERSSRWLVGGRLGYQSERLRAAISAHEQREPGGVARRNLGLDLSARPSATTTLGASALGELDARSIAEARAWLDLEPHPALRASVEVFHAQPSLLLSRQSVLSVFSSDGYRELGGVVAVRAQPWLLLEGSGYAQTYDTGRPGARGEAAARVELDRHSSAFARVAYARVIVADTGYQSVRSSLGGDLARRLRGTLDLHGFFYDEAVRGRRTSSVCSATLDYQATERLGLLWGASLAQTPYARLDAQTLVRVSYDWQAPALVLR